jgi:hypothetical protein
MRTISFSPDIEAKIRVAAARHNISGTIFIRAAVSAALAELADRDQDLAAVFRSIESEGARRPSDSRLPVPA